MNASHSTKRFIGLGSLLILAAGFTGSVVLAGCASATTAKPSGTAKPGDQTAMVCPACKTTVLLAPDEIRPNRSGIPTRTPVTGFTHKCEHCGGTLTALKGGMTNAMQGNCAMCGKDAERCIAALHPAKTA